MFSNPRKKPLGFSNVGNDKVYNKNKDYKDEKYKAISLFDNNQFDDAYVSFKHLLKRKKNDPQLYIFIGIIEAKRENYKDAIINLKKAEEIDNKITQIYFNLGKIYNNLNEIKLSIYNYQKSIEVDSYFHLSYQNLILILFKEGNFEEAGLIIKKGLKHMPYEPILNYNYALVLSKLNEYKEATNQFNKLLISTPKNVGVKINFGHLLSEMHLFNEAKNQFENAIKLEPHSPALHMSYSELLFRMGEYEASWKEYEWRFVGEKCEVPLNISPIAIRGNEYNYDNFKKILLIAEQGLGDTLQFIRFAKLLREKGKIIYLWAPKQLHSIIKQSNLIDKFLSIEEASNFKEGCYVPLMSLPKLFEVPSKNSFSNEIYLKTCINIDKKWSKNLLRENKKIIGIHWQGNPEQEKSDGIKNKRSFPLSCFTPLSKIENISLISLQKGFGSEQFNKCQFIDKFVENQKEIDEIWDFSEIASIIKNCDLIITSDSAIAHLSGGLGVETWLLLKYLPDWRWEVYGERTKWYKNIKIFRQTVKRNWNEVHEKVASEVKLKFINN